MGLLLKDKAMMLNPGGLPSTIHDFELSQYHLRYRFIYRVECAVVGRLMITRNFHRLVRSHQTLFSNGSRLIMVFDPEAMINATRFSISSTHSYRSA